jgi:hypothetical protein
MRCTAAASIRSNCVRGKAARLLNLIIRHGKQAADRTVLLLDLSDRLCQRASCENGGDRAARLAPRGPQLDHLDEEHGPGGYRRQRKTDHDRLHDDVRLHEHAHGRQGIGQRGDDHRPIR